MVYDPFHVLCVLFLDFYRIGIYGIDILDVQEVWLPARLGNGRHLVDTIMPSGRPSELLASSVVELLLY